MLMGVKNWSIAKLSSVQLAIVIYIVLTMVSGSTGSMLTKIARLFLFGVCVASFFQSKKIVIRKGCRFYIGWSLTFLIYAAIGCQFAYSKSYAQEYLMTLLYVVICDILIVLYVARNIEFVPTMLKAVIVGAILKAAYTFLTSGFMAFLSSRSTSGTSANTIGFYCAFAALFSIYFYLQKKRLIYTFTAALNVLFLLLSASRKALLFLAIPVIVVMICRSKNPLRLIRNIVFIIIIAGLGLFLLLKVNFLYNLIGNRIEGMIYGFLGSTEDADASTKTRLKLIQYGLIWFKEKPIFGHGLSNFKPLWISRNTGSSTTLYAHNNYIELLVDCGLVGTILFYSLHLKTIVAALRNKKYLDDLQILLFGMLIAIVICDYGMVSYYEVFTNLMLLLSFLCINTHIYSADDRII